MRFRILHEIRGRIRLGISVKHMTAAEADCLQYYISTLDGVTSVKVRERTASAVISFTCPRNELIRSLLAYDKSRAPQVPEAYSSGRALNNKYYDVLVTKTALHFGRRLFLPAPLRAGITVLRSVRYIREGLLTLLRGKIEVPVLDAAAITVSMLRGDFTTAASVMFLLGIGETLEEWTHKKSVDDLARSMSLHISKVWLRSGDQEVLVDARSIQAGDLVVVHMGNVVPFDGTVESGEGMVNQASLTGESLPVRKTAHSTVYAGTVLEEGELVVCVREVNGSSKFDKIVSMIEDSEKLKSQVESRAEHLADRLVPYTLAGAALTGLLTGNPTKAVSVLMVDFSCALKLAMPISVLSAIREAGDCQVTVKGGKYLEAVADADTIVFDKTGTLTKAHPRVAMIVSFDENDSEDECLRVAACLEEHFPHSIATAVVEAAKERGLEHEEMHAKVEYIVAHGIATTISGKRAVIGSYHFIFEDEGCSIPEGKEELFRSIPDEYSHLYLAREGRLSAVICIEDPLRKEAPDVVRSLKAEGFSNVVMMTGDSRRTAASIAAKDGVDQFFAEVLPEDKAGFIEKEKREGHKVVMIGDGINDSPALSAADAGIAISDGAEIAREIADITVSGEDLAEVVMLKKIADGLMRRIRYNFRTIVGFNTGLIVLGVLGILPPTTSALLHNGSTLAIGLASMRNLVGEDEKAQITGRAD